MLTSDIGKRAGLVRAVALDGSVWWVRPESADSIRAFRLTDIQWREPLGVNGQPVPPAAKLEKSGK